MAKPLPALSLSDWAVLAVVAEGETHGWPVVLALREDGALGQVWTVGRPIVYRSLSTLAGLGLIEERGDVAGREVRGGRSCGQRGRDTRRCGAGSQHRSNTYATCAPSCLLKLALLDRADRSAQELVERQVEQLEPVLRAVTERPAGDGFDLVLARWRREQALAVQRFLHSLIRRTIRLGHSTSRRDFPIVSLRLRPAVHDFGGLDESRVSASRRVGHGLLRARRGRVREQQQVVGLDALDASTPTTPAKLSGSLNVFAAASLTEAFNDEKTALASSDPGLSLTYDFAGSQALVTQIKNGAPADVFASADQKNMQKLIDAGLVETPKTFARNKLEIAVAPGNPKHITGLADLEKSGVILVLEDPSVPAGNYARQAFTKAGLPAPKPTSNELDVKSTLAKLTSGDADAVVVYVTDVKAAGSKVEGVEIPDSQNVIATYPIAAIKASKHLTAAEAFVDEVVSGSGQQALQARGFLAPN